MKTLSITLAGLLLTVNTLFAQHAKFVSSGTVEYEKSSNMYALIKKVYSGSNMGSLADQMMDQMKRNTPQFKILKSTLAFGGNKTLFTPIVPDVMPMGFNSMISDQINTIYTDYTANTSVVQKKVADATFLISDTARKINWKITEETRDILGYPCRRANALILDSVYVVAFYTDKIAVPGGPESFGGLPGMILQLAIPHENLSWIATKVTEADAPPATIVAPQKGKAANNKQFRDFLNGLLGKGRDPGQVGTALKGYLL